MDTQCCVYGSGANAGGADCARPDPRHSTELQAGHIGTPSNPEDGNWLMVRRTYNGWGYSPLYQITVGNVQRLQPVWVLATGVNNGHEAVRS